MAYTIHKLDEDPIIVASASGRVSTTMLQAMFGEAAEACWAIRGVTCFLADFSGISDFGPDDYAQVLHIIRDGLRSLRDNSSFFSALVMPSELGELLSASLIHENIELPYFHTIEEAHSYLSLKVGITNLKLNLSTVDTEETAQVDETMLDQETRTNIQGTHVFPTYGLLRVGVLGTNKSILVFPVKGVIIGRRDAHTHEKPDVDLSLWSSSHSGVSRRHAKVVLANNTLHLYDLGSKNGTLLNGTKLPPFRANLVHDGDHVQIGTLMLEFTFYNK